MRIYFNTSALNRPLDDLSSDRVRIEAEAVKRKCFRISVLNSRERESYKRGFYPSLGYEERPQTATFTKRLDWGEG